MAKIKIVSNPYDQKITYYELTRNDEKEEYLPINYDTKPGSALLSEKNVMGFFPFNVKNIVDVIIDEYQSEGEKVSIVFEGTDDEFIELASVCAANEYIEKVNIERSNIRLANARDILPEITRIFTDHLNSLIMRSIDEAQVEVELRKYSDVTQDTIPICVLGNYSAGKSTFINALIGSEILPSGDEPITAKIYQIKRSPSMDRAFIELVYEGEKFKIIFKERENDIVFTGGDKPLYTNIKKALDVIEDEKISVRVNRALEIINSFDRNDEPDAISNLISIQVPFVGGLWGQANRNFVIFDTPGSNSASNNKHLEVLKEQMHNLSNGLPIFLSEYDSLDSTDNERLYNVIHDIDELDSRFTMIVVNKADAARIPKTGFSEADVDQILAMAVPRNLYTEGIYFVSSIVGLGSKNDAEFVDDHLAEIYEGEERKYGDPSSRFYKRLYQYNIMPEQLKRKAVEVAGEYAEKGKELIYVNSGLFSVETEIQTFAERYSHYNKCKQAYMFLTKIIGHTSDEIEKTKKEREKQRTEITNEFEQDKKELNAKIKACAHRLEKEGKAFYSIIMDQRMQSAEIVYTKDELENIEAEFIKHQEEEKRFEDRQADVLRARDARNSNFRENVERLFTERNMDALRELSSDLLVDTVSINHQYDLLRDIKHQVDRTASDELLERIKGDFTNHISETQTLLQDVSRDYWISKSEEIRKALITIVTGSDALSDEKKAELTDLILAFDNVNLEAVIDNTFVRDDFEKGLWIGSIKIISSDRLDISKLVTKYKAKTTEIIKILGAEIMRTHGLTVNSWIQNLLNCIDANIVELNASLCEQAQNIRDITKKIEELEKRQSDLTHYTEQIRSMMDWSEV